MNAEGPSKRPLAGRAGLNPDRGLGWALLLGAIGFLTPIVLGLAFTVGRWLIFRSPEPVRAWDLNLLPTYLALPSVGTAIVFAANGWAWRAAGGRYRFTPTLSIIFAVGIPSWFFLFHLANSYDPPHHKHSEPLHKSLIEPRDVLILALPAFMTAFVLSAIRAIRRSSTMGNGLADPDLA